MIAAWAEENGVDLDAPEAQAAKDEHDRDMENAYNHELSVAAENYARQVRDWFHEESEMTVSDDSGLPAVEENKDDIREASEVIHWYQFQIAAKTMRALMSRDDDDEETEAVVRDSDGSIKVALIGMDRSISAWRIMQMAVPDKANSVVPLILSLENLRRETEKEFPHARDFIRPGFDEVSDALLQ